TCFNTCNHSKEAIHEPEQSFLENILSMEKICKEKYSICLQWVGNCFYKFKSDFLIHTINNKKTGDSIVFRYSRNRKMIATDEIYPVPEPGIQFFLCDAHHFR